MQPRDTVDLSYIQTGLAESIFEHVGRPIYLHSENQSQIYYTED